MKKKLVEKDHSSALLELRDVGKYFGGLKAVDHVNISVNEGDLHCLIGPNGAGKSTIFKMVMGVYKPTMGSIYFKNKNITNLKSWDRVRQGVSIKMQIPGVFGELTVYENMKIAAQRYYRHSELKNKILEICDLLGITHLRDEIVNNLSHGQQQWLEIGMSLASDPELLLLDEPAAGMGPEETNFTAELIRKLNQKGITILFIDHDMDFVKKIARKVTVLHFGKTFAEGSVEEIESNQDVVDIYLGKS
ncbi:ATP-binding cassette domain-containing protein [Terrilactibacillus sp. BCM23-1]|uniref:ATP-binding cassette domain-containing protein n=1 Tax=Terrilactibacillus tamarindi TaxID=2599694 RepID=A0A6N8CSL2_9BACI|nr:ABC transporter ATP-binding protein [Terrilactibacillus tamarindi]MTT32187.1 ATP-binding cassette domain-containing protein [Terrilactibacillus tamarindi]